MRELLAAGYASYSELKNLIVWNKDNGGMGSFYRSKHELVCQSASKKDPLSACKRDPLRRAA